MARKTKDEEEYDEVSPDERTNSKAISDERVRKRIEEYESDFEADSITTVDRAQIKRMAKIELAADDATDELTTNPNLTPSQRKSLSDTAKSLSGEARQLADSLGMSRQKRLTEEEAEQEALIPKIYKEAKEFLDQHAVAIVCPHCRDERASVEIIAGTIIYHFSFESEWEWKSKCPRCSNVFTINQDNYIDFRMDTLNKYEDRPGEISVDEDEEDDGQEEI